MVSQKTLEMGVDFFHDGTLIADNRGPKSMQVYCSSGGDCSL
jgi:hypothetical protein